MVVALIVAAAPRPAGACTCVQGLPSDLIDSSDLAFVGTVLDRQETFDGAVVETMFAVTETLKGDIGATVILAVPADAACVGALGDGPIGVVANDRQGEVLPELCTVTEPDQLLAAATALGLEVTAPEAAEAATPMPESTSSYAAAIPMSILLSLVFLASVALGERTARANR